jgi:hypothetical protein
MGIEIAKPVIAPFSQIARKTGTGPRLKKSKTNEIENDITSPSIRPVSIPKVAGLTNIS